MLKYPPLFLSRRRQKTDGESKSGLRRVRFRFKSITAGAIVVLIAYQHMKSMLPSSPARAQVCMLPTMP